MDGSPRAAAAAAATAQVGPEARQVLGGKQQWVWELGFCSSGMETEFCQLVSLSGVICGIE